ncbi:MAG: glycosyltransferase [Candidatus Sumerlaeaceae bacterium]|nr:glycosyltransferase [Candidatus Sumerlaeaceae bacterium]
MHVFWPPPAGMIAGHLSADTPLVVTLGAPDVTAAIKWLEERNGNTVFAANDGAALAALRRAGFRTVLIPPALPEDAFEAPAPEARVAARSGASPGDAVFFLFTDSHPDLPMIRCGVPTRLCTAGFDSPQWPDALLSADVFVHLRQHLTPALAEASARGCAIISVDSPEIGSVFAGGISAVLVPDGDRGALESAMREFSASPVLSESFGEQARLAAAEHFDAAAVAVQYRELYDSLQRS